MEIRGIKYISPLFDTSGYAQASRGYVLALHKMGIPITVSPVSFEKMSPNLGEDGKILYNLQGKNIDYNIVITHLTAEWWAKHYESDKTNIGYTVWETDKLHPDWPGWINKYDAAMVGSEWTVDVCKKSGVTIPVHAVPHGIDLSQFNDIVPYDLSNVKKDAYKFYSVFQFTERKHPVALIKSYWYAFQNKENVALILKTYRSNFDDDEKEAIRRTIKRLKEVTPMDHHPPIYTILGMLSRDELLGLHKAGDCFVSLDRGEGFGLCVADNTSILTQDGVKSAKNISCGDLVLSMDGRFHEVSNVASRYVEYGIQISSKLHEDIVVSGDHPFYTIKNLTRWKRYNWDVDKIEKELLWTKASDISVGDYIALPKPILDNDVLNTYLDINDFVSLDGMVVSDTDIYLKNGYSSKNVDMSYKYLVDTYGYTKKIFESAVHHLKSNTIPKKRSKTYDAFYILLSIGYVIKTPNTISRKIKITNDVLNLFGWYIAEGSTNNDTFLELDCNINEYKILERIAHTFKFNFGIDGNSIFLQKYGNKSRLIVSNKIVATLFSNLFGSGASNKHIPNWLYVSGKYLKPLLRGLFDGDGYNDGSTYALSTTSCTLAYQVKSIFNSMGCCPRISNEGCSTIGNFDRYIVGVSNKDYEYFTGKPLEYDREFFIQTKSFFIVKVTNIKSIEYNNLMYDFSVVGAKSFVGNGLLLHNCPFEAGAFAKPIIVTGMGGVLEYAKPDNSYLVNYTMTPVSGMPWAPWYRGDQLWAEPDCWHAIQTMRHIYSNQDKAVAKGIALRKYIENNLTWEHVGKRMVDIIRSL